MGSAAPAAAARLSLFTPPRLRVGSGHEKPRHATWLELLAAAGISPNDFAD